MKIAKLDDIHIHYADEGDPAGAPVVFANSLGTDLRVWEAVLPHLPAGLRLIRYDKRGHGLSDAPVGPYAMETLVTDVERLMDYLRVRDAVFVGLSIGGMIAQGLAARRADLVRAMVLSNTAAKIGTPDMWQERVTTARARGISAMADGVLERWFTPAFRAGAEFAGWRNMLVRQSAEGYAGCCGAIAGTDLASATAELRLPTLGIAGSEDGSTPPDLVRETVELIPGSRFEIIRDAGHLPCVERPEEVAGLLTQFMKETGHV